MSTPEDLSVQLAGPWMVGCIASLFWFGIICSQFVTYLSVFADDHRWVRTACLVVFITTALKAVFEAATLWSVFVPSWIAGNTAGIYNWASYGSFIDFIVIVAVAQSFFIARVARLYRSWWIAVPAAVLLTASSAFGLFSFALTRLPFDESTPSKFLMANLGQMWCLVPCNVYVTILLSRRLTGASVHRRNRYVLERLFRLTVSNCLLTASLSAINGSLLPFAGKGRLANANIPFYLLIPYAWASSLLYTVNSRREILYGADDRPEREGPAPPPKSPVISSAPTVEELEYDFSASGGSATDGVPGRRRSSAASAAARLFGQRPPVDTAAPAPRSPNNPELLHVPLRAALDRKLSDTVSSV